MSYALVCLKCTCLIIALCVCVTAVRQRRSVPVYPEPMHLLRVTARCSGLLATPRRPCARATCAFTPSSLKHCLPGKGVRPGVARRGREGGRGERQRGVRAAPLHIPQQPLLRLWCLGVSGGMVRASAACVMYVMLSVVRGWQNQNAWWHTPTRPCDDGVDQALQVPRRCVLACPC